MTDTITEPAIADPPADPIKNTQKASAARDRPPRKTAGKGRGGARPGAGRKPAGETRAREDKMLLEGLTRLLSIPAMPAAMLGQTWTAEHFTNAAPQMANALVQAGATNDKLRATLLSALEGDTYALLLIGVFGYAVPPLLYYLTQDDHPVRSFLGVPPRQAAPGLDPTMPAPQPVQGPGRAPDTSPVGRPSPPAPNGRPIAESQQG